MKTMKVQKVTCPHGHNNTLAGPCISCAIVEERKLIATWLRRQAPNSNVAVLADALDRGEHIQ